MKTKRTYVYIYIYTRRYANECLSPSFKQTYFYACNTNEAVNPNIQKVGGRIGGWVEGEVVWRTGRAGG